MSPSTTLCPYLFEGGLLIKTEQGQEKEYALLKRGYQGTLKHLLLRLVFFRVLRRKLHQDPPAFLIPSC